ncbi:MobC family plasmid mobilization relaxosome protein [Campylobacter coli]|uniref:plasmid mobilization protein n=1 Tax=Campylobacter coli TaxID=195 RepID=UPI000931E0CE|nr:plasmid mobilization relaxosome protein MobC [Campylobacter coli]MPA79927.1 MobC family plasmid mobilization relaxosome protein [Campylobacter coli]
MEEKKEKKELRKTIRFTQKELEEIKEKANNLNMSFSQYIVYSALNKQLASKKNPLYKDLTTQLAKVGNNLNQIAKTCNTEKTINKHIASNLILVISELQKELSNITKKLNGVSDDN